MQNEIQRLEAEIKKKGIEKRILGEENFELREYVNKQEELFKYKKLKFIL